MCDVCTLYVRRVHTMLKADEGPFVLGLDCRTRAVRDIQAKTGDDPRSVVHVLCARTNVLCSRTNVLCSRNPLAAIQNLLRRTLRVHSRSHHARGIPSFFHLLNEDVHRVGLDSYQAW